MGIDGEEAATLTIGPTATGMVRLLVTGEGVELPMDFEPDEADEIADEIRAAAMRPRDAARPGRRKTRGRR